MKPNELRLGDYIKYDAEDDIFKVIVLEETVSFKNSKGLVLEEKYKNIKPIKLTRECLERAGFIRMPFSGYKKVINGNTISITDLYESTSKKWTIHIDDKEFMCLFYYEINYLHELQHIIYDVCGKELKLKDYE